MHAFCWQNHCCEVNSRHPQFLTLHPCVICNISLTPSFYALVFYFSFLAALCRFLLPSREIPLLFLDCVLFFSHVFYALILLYANLLCVLYLLFSVFDSPGGLCLLIHCILFPCVFCEF